MRYWAEHHRFFVRLVERVRPSRLLAGLSGGAGGGRVGRLLVVAGFCVLFAGALAAGTWAGGSGVASLLGSSSSGSDTTTAAVTDSTTTPTVTDAASADTTTTVVASTGTTSTVSSSGAGGPQPMISCDTAPTNSSPPSVSGGNGVGSQINSSSGTWYFGNAGCGSHWLNYAWFRGSSGVGSNQSWYTVVSDDQGYSISSKVQGCNDAYGCSGWVSSSNSISIPPANHAPDKGSVRNFV